MTLWEECVYWDKLPRWGGILDQPYGLLERMRVCVGVYQAIKAYSQNWTVPGWLDAHQDVLLTMTHYWEIRDEVERGTE